MSNKHEEEDDVLPREKINNHYYDTNLTSLNLSIKSSKSSEYQLTENDLEKLCKFTSLKELNLSGHCVKEFPENICNLVNLKTLILSKNQLKTVPKNTWTLTSLQTLSIRLNQIKKWPVQINKLPKLESLDLAFNELSSCGFGFKKRVIPNVLNTLNQKVEKTTFKTQTLMTSLKHLDISFNNLESFPVRVAYFKNLESFDLSRNLVKDIPNDIVRLQNLKVLNLEQIGLEKFPTAICTLQQLEKLNLSNNKIGKLATTDEFKLLSNLTEINLEGCDIQAWSQLTTQPNLKILNLSNNHIAGIPFEARSLQHLEELKLNKNRITNIPAHIDSLLSLTFADFSDNLIDEIDPNIGNLETLQVLKLNNNMISVLPKEIGNLENLKEFYITKNQLKKIPNISNLKKLVILHASQNQLESIPEGIGNCQLLENIDFTFNRIKQIPLELYKLQQLKNLRLKHNAIEELHKEVSGLISLEQLNLDNNEISEIPLEVCKLTKLRLLSLNYNMDKYSIPQEIKKWQEKYNVEIPLAYDTICKVIDGLYISGANAASSKKQLLAHNITHVLTVAADIPPQHIDQFYYMVIYVDDVSTATLRPHFEEVSKFIDQGRKQGGVLVHCMAGASRSATMVTQYLMVHKKIKLKDAFGLLKKARPEVRPNPTFRAELKKYEKYLFENCQEDPRKPANKVDIFSPTGEVKTIPSEKEEMIQIFESNEWRKIFANTEDKKLKRKSIRLAISSSSESSQQENQSTTTLQKQERKKSLLSNLPTSGSEETELLLYKPPNNHSEKKNLSVNSNVNNTK